VKPNRGRIVQPMRDAPNAEPTFLPEPPKKLIFGQHSLCTRCKGKGKWNGALCKLCRGTGIEIN